MLKKKEYFKNNIRLSRLLVENNYCLQRDILEFIDINDITLDGEKIHDESIMIKKTSKLYINGTLVFNIKRLPKIRQFEDTKQKAVSGVRELKEYLYNKRSSLTYEEINTMVNSVVYKVYEMAHEIGWDSRNEIHQVRKSEHLRRIIKAFNDFHKEYAGQLPIKTMDQIRYIVDIALLNRYFNEDYTLQRQVNDRQV
jgi:isocitrate/isopropylmalate dehydrogenase